MPTTRNSLLPLYALLLTPTLLVGCATKSTPSVVVAEPVTLPPLSAKVESLRHKSSADFSLKVSTFLQKVENSTRSETPK